MPDLNLVLDEMLESGTDFSAERNAEIHARFFTVDREAQTLHDTSVRMESLLADILAQAGAMGEDAAEYGEVLKSVSGQMGSVKEPDNVKAIVTNVLTATRVMEKKNRDLETRLTESTAQVGKLKGDLEDMRREALTDGLTGIANRKNFDMILRAAAMESAENGDDLALLMIDIDYFKKFNDTFGHQVGDQVLRLLSATLRDCVKGQDTPARYGGEEFSVILPHTSLKNAFAVAETIRMQVANKKVVNKKTGQDMGRITVSLGVSRFDHGEPLAQFIARADQALYLAKRTGRNRVMTETDLVESEAAC
ncbi:MAG: diguanylate cyclase [Hyphomicrobiales bacterium]|nr:diguanylate cyclase [Hyphomicrobiales bacterium]MCP5373375.1 diguanylate cyclase [Hyphomicrobiales bacterium]